ncbi:3-hydroxyisobutyrate dehydrogenase [Luminiphilus sp.]|nr:3-hydroxyisobutyrate dehydrogenase [Luminiphilus sp.]MDA8826087.1 3-hydroxyisobutyrate dehydrogenase [Luminiphilus sp.]
MTNIAFIGLGNMGGPMAKNLLAAGHTLHIFDLSEVALNDVATAGATVAGSAVDACKNAEVVITMLPAGKHVRQVYIGDDGLLAHLLPGTLCLDASTIDSDTARDVGLAVAEQGIEFMDTPVSGGVAAAQAGTLAFMCGGTPAAFERAKVILEAMGNGEKIFHAGPAGAGQVAKAANNMLLAVHMIGTCEALAMGAKAGLEPAVLSEIMKASSGNNWSLQVYNPWPEVMPGAPAGNNYEPGFMVDLMVKDLGLAKEVAGGTGVDNRLGRLALEIYQAHQAEGHGSLDFSSILNSVLEHSSQ